MFNPFFVDVFLSIKSPISAAQKVITYYWIGNRITYVTSTINVQYYDDIHNKNGKRWILEIYDASIISDKRVIDIAGIQNGGHLVTNASVYLILNYRTRRTTTNRD